MEEKEMLYRGDNITELVKEIKRFLLEDALAEQIQ